MQYSQDHFTNLLMKQYYDLTQLSDFFKRYFLCDLLLRNLAVST